jgi:hypothetical protein
MASIQHPISGVYYGYDTVEDGWASQQNGNLKLLGSITQIGVISATTTAEPVGPTDGDAYIIPPSATGTSWAGQDGKLAIYIDETGITAGVAAWYITTPTTGWKAYSADSNATYEYDGSAWVLEGSEVTTGIETTIAGLAVANGAGNTYNSQEGWYYKHGAMVQVRIKLDISNLDQIASTFGLGALPAILRPTTNVACHITVSDQTTLIPNTVNPIHGTVTSGGIIRFHEQDGSTNINNDDMNASGVIDILVSYLQM